jgi:transcriptional regulator with XRE-family HTH domain
MSDKEILELLRESFVSEDAPPLTAEEAEMFMSAPLPAKSSQAMLKKARKHSSENALARLHQEPVRSVRQGVSFGPWLEQERKSAYLTRADIAAAIGKDTSYIEKVEEEEILPWKITPNMMANIVILFRVHVDALKQLLSSALRADRARSDRGSSSFQFAAMSDPLERRSSKTETGNSGELTLNEEMVILLEKLHKILEHRQADYLL